jgi:predicted PurR-regulated permease PerM
MKVPGLHDWISEIGDDLNSIINTTVKTLVSGGIGVAGSTVSAVWLVLLFVILASMLVVYAPEIYKVTLRLTRLPEDSLQRFIQSLRSAFRAVFAGILFIAIIQGTLCAIGFRLMSVSEPAFWGLLATFAAVIPVIGTSLVWFPLAVVLWFSGSPYGAVGLVIWGIVVVAGADNLLRPYLLKTGIDASMFVLLLSILCGLVVFGPVGLIAGPVLVAFAKQAIKESDILLERDAQ